MKANEDHEKKEIKKLYGVRTISYRYFHAMPPGWAWNEKSTLSHRF